MSRNLIHYSKGSPNPRRDDVEKGGIYYHSNHDETYIVADIGDELYLISLQNGIAFSTDGLWGGESGIDRHTGREKFRKVEQAFELKPM